MNQPGIKLTWGEEWKRHEKRHARPFMEAAVGLAVEGLNYLELELSSPREVRVVQTVRTYPDCAEINGQTVQLLLKCIDVRHGRYKKMVGPLSAFTLHEFVHTERNEVISPATETLTDRAINEGLAHIAEDLYAKELLDPDQHDDFLGKIQRIDPKVMTRLCGELAAVSQPIEDMSSAVIDKWIEPKDITNGWPPVAAVGAHYVQNALTQGLSLQEIVTTDTALLVA